MESKKCSHKFFWSFIIFLIIVLLGSMLVNFGLIFSSVLGKSDSLSEKAIDEFPKLKEIWSYGKGTSKAVRIEIKGTIFRSREKGLFTPKKDKIENIISQINAAKNDSFVKAIILEVESPGGAITPSDEIYHALMNFKKSDSNRKVIVFMKSIAASGGYYISMAGDHIIAEPTSIIGSIGVIIQTLNWKSLSEKIGITDTTIASGKNKDMLNPFKDVSDEQIELLENMVKTLHERFITIVKESRNIELSKLDFLADGRIFSSKEAIENNLIDEIGYWQDVVKKTSSLCNEKELKIIRYEHMTTFMDLFTEARRPIDVNITLDTQVPELMYLWKP
ncbi:MAG: signal peptide peptidase SppA [Candidatus Aureabacteria bacterium]|nr:signal peptide peptidase SppA [Candidatus Auribacterota bacterium]